MLAKFKFWDCLQIKCKYSTKINFLLIGSKFFMLANFIVILGIVIVLQL